MSDTKAPLLQLVDGAVLDFSEDNWFSDGCETCDYGSSYIQDFTVKTTQGDYRFDFDQMYEYAISHEFLFKAVLPNAEAIKAMTVGRFIEWLTEQFQAVIGKDSWRNVKFKHYKVGENA